MSLQLCIDWYIIFVYVCCLWVKQKVSVCSQKVCLCTGIHVFLRVREDNWLLWKRERGTMSLRISAGHFVALFLFHTVYFFTSVHDNLALTMSTAECSQMTVFRIKVTILISVEYQDWERKWNSPTIHISYILHEEGWNSAII